MARLSIRVDLKPGNRIGPGKIQLLEMIAEHGSISAAGRAIGMSYRRAWTLTEALNAGFGRPMVEVQIGGRSGGGARLTAFGTDLVRAYRAIEAAAAEAAAPFLNGLDAGTVTPGDGEGAPVERTG
ncbi:LysR family transcriptional regulator [Methylobacterium sp. Leaf91]|uniref:winged helix-turn-helix domain-containing protein n=1 Tax=Methylobacterium sp. Leaf91 TaxID=1736247 RepID=UPI0006FC250B|nr:LysR family transcriptional regulator [Methylobacterium sp. Leaf91]KQP00459.1 LysR family transcriptional regulator [Methylobacterium sp. Leaf91]